MAALVARLCSRTTISSSSSSSSSSSYLVFVRGIASKLFVGGLSHQTTEKTLSDAFTQYGQVIEAKIIQDRVSERSKGFGFVTYASIDEAEKALSEMDGKQLDGRVIFVDHAKIKIDYGGGMPIVACGPPKSK